MKFQNPSFNIFLNGRTDAQTDKLKAICSPLFQSWGHKKVKWFLRKTSFNFDMKMTLGQSQEMSLTLNSKYPFIYSSTCLNLPMFRSQAAIVSKNSTVFTFSYRNVKLPKFDFAVK